MPEKPLNAQDTAARVCLFLFVFRRHRHTPHMDKENRSFSAMFTSEGRKRKGVTERQDGLHYVCDTELPNTDNVAETMRNTNICRV